MTSAPAAWTWLGPSLMCPGPFTIWTVSQVGSIIIRSSGTKPAFTVGLGYISVLTFSVKAGKKGWGVASFHLPNKALSSAHPVRAVCFQ